MENEQRTLNTGRHFVIRITQKILVFIAALAALGFAGAVSIVMITFFYFAPGLPSVEVLKDVRLQVPLRIYTSDGKLLGEFGEKRRVPVGYKEIPERVIQAFIASEDDRYYEHPGVDYQGLVRAAWSLLQTREIRQGGSTITMQVARGYLLSSEKTFVRKIREIFLSLRMERELNKAEILELYLNGIFLGHRAYGVGAAADVYYGKTLDQLTLAEITMIAGLPQAPSRLNPISSPQRAQKRRAYVLRRMLELDYITQDEHDLAFNAPVSAEIHRAHTEVDAPHLAELVRSQLLARFGEELYTAGYRVTTTIDSEMQQAASDALRRGLIDYDQRHGFRGAVDKLVLTDIDVSDYERVLAKYPSTKGFDVALVIKSEPQVAQLVARETGLVELDLAAISWAKEHVNQNVVRAEPKQVNKVLAVGDVVYLRQVAVEKTEQAADDGTAELQWQLAQIPNIQGAMVALRPQDGAILALTGGFDFYLSKFNRATQAKRQPGSTYKPFIYASALANGFTPASIVLDAPVVLEEKYSTWRPENFSEGFKGPTRLREALAFSRNLVSIRVLRAVGVGPTVNYLKRFGFTNATPDLAIALGSPVVSPLQLARGYAVFANGGYLIEPYFVSEVRNHDGDVVLEAQPRTICRDCEQAILSDVEIDNYQALDTDQLGAPATANAALTDDLEQSSSVGSITALTSRRFAPMTISPQVAYLMRDMMQDVIRYGTGKQANSLGRKDLAGKTGTSNDFRDAWFAGYNNRVVAISWVGFDQERSLGRGEAGGRAALPIWIDFMTSATRGMPEDLPERPNDLINVRISRITGEAVPSGAPDSMIEMFRSRNAPRLSGGATSNQDPTSAAPTDVADLF
ncbi:MAG: penicillin-binding protein 1A [Gammaproteobacteria bacterium]|nr:penicillin-binding protein 1A [Gammaproteobacteria bacterium]